MYIYNFEMPNLLLDTMCGKIVKTVITIIVIFDWEDKNFEIITVIQFIVLIV